MVVDKKDLHTMVYQANELICANKPYSINELRILYIGLASVLPNMPKDEYEYVGDFATAYVPMDLVMQLFGGNKAYYSLLHEACKGMFTKYIEIEDTETNEFTLKHVFEEIRWSTTGSKPGLYIKFAGCMKPYIMDLKRRAYTKSMLKYAFYLSSEYSLKLLEMALKVQNQRIPEFEMTIEEVRKYLAIPEDAYKNRIDNFKRRVLDNPLEEIRTKLGKDITYTPIKKGRSVIGFRFRLNQ